MDLSYLVVGRLDDATVPPLSYAKQTLAYIERARRDADFDASMGPLGEILDCACCDLSWLIDATFTTPAADGAPWYDATDPASGEFLGVLMVGHQGLDDVVGDRTVTDNPILGGMPGRRHKGPRTVTFEGRLFATSDRGMEYGRRWVAHMLAADCEDCDDVRAARFLAYCPEVTGPNPAVPCGAFRELVDVKLTSGPLFTPVFENDPLAATFVQRVAFDLTSPSPFLFGTRAFETDDETGCWSTCDVPVTLPADGVGDRWASGAPVWATQQFEPAWVDDATLAATRIWAGSTDTALYFDGYATVGYGSLVPGAGPWTDVDDADTTPGQVVLAGLLTDVDLQVVTKLTVVVQARWLSRSAVTHDPDISLTIADGDGNRLDGTPSGGTRVSGPDRAGSWRGDTDHPQTYAYTIEGEWTGTEIGTFAVALLARSRTKAAVVDDISIEGVEVFAQGYRYGNTSSVEDCACNWCRDRCRPTYTCCTIIPPPAADIAPIITFSADVDAHVEIGRTDPSDTDGCTPPVDGQNITYETIEEVTDSDDADLIDFAAVEADNAANIGGDTHIDGSAVVGALPYDWTGADDVDTWAIVGLAITPDPPECTGTATLLSVTARFRYTPTSDAGGPSDEKVMLTVASGGTRLPGVGNGAAQTGADRTVDGYQPIGIGVDLRYRATIPDDYIVGTPVQVYVLWRTAGGDSMNDGDELTIEAFDITTEWLCDDPAYVQSPAWQCAEQCSKFNVAPIGSTVTVDGRLGAAYTGRYYDHSWADDAIVADGDAPLRWPQACCGPLCICVAGRATNPEGSTVSVRWVPRYEV